MGTQKYRPQPCFLAILFALYICNVHHTGTTTSCRCLWDSRSASEKRFISMPASSPGFASITLLCAFFCAKLNEWIPEIRLPMLVLGTIYLIWLAVKILRSTYDTKAVEPKKGQAYLSGLLLQFVNVKVMVSAIVSIQMFVLPYYQSTEALAAFAIFIGDRRNKL